MISISEREPVEVLKYPYPYQAAFTVASDIDSANIMRFRGVHALFCGRELIKENSPEWHALGLSRNCPRFDKDSGGVHGLGLDLADSFFLVGDPTTFGLYRHMPDQDRFREDEQQGENCATLIRRWIKEGSIDSYHTFLHYERRQIEPLLKAFFGWCERENVAKPRVWINHSKPAAPSGLCPDSLQLSRINLLARQIALKIVGPLLGRKSKPLRYALARYQGDTPGSPYYVNDLMAANGLRYVWLNAGTFPVNKIGLFESQQNGRATFLQAVTMNDGIRFYHFHRCLGVPTDRRDGIAYLRDSKEGFDSSVLISEKNLDELCRSNGTCILYTHWTHHRSMPISDETIGRFELLQRWRDSGKIWVTSTKRLLEWTRRRTFLKVLCRREGKRLVVDIKGVEDPIFGYEALDLNALHGLCLHLQPSETDLHIAVNNQTLNPGQYHRTGQLCWLDAGHPSNLRPNPQAGKDVIVGQGNP